MAIKADYNAIDARLCDMSEIVKEVRNEIDLMDETIENLGIFWYSDASGEYALRITADMCVIRALSEKINLIIHSVREALMKLDTAEMQVGSLIEEM